MEIIFKSLKFESPYPDPPFLPQNCSFPLTELQPGMVNVEFLLRLTNALS